MAEYNRTAKGITKGLSYRQLASHIGFFVIDNFFKYDRKLNSTLSTTISLVCGGPKPDPHTHNHDSTRNVHSFRLPFCRLATSDHKSTSFSDEVARNGL